MSHYHQTFTESYQRALGNSSYNADFISYFYDQFLAKSERVRQMFSNTNMSAQKTMLHDSLQYLLEFYSTGDITPHMQRLARVHGNKGHKVPPELYELWLDSLMEAVAKFDPEFNREIELSWRLVLAPGITFIKFMGDTE